MKYRHSNGAVAPLSMIFAFVSMLLTVAYLGNSSTINYQERFRFAEITAQYIAEAGLNREAADYLPYLSGADTTLVGDMGVDFGEDNNGNFLGRYKNVICGTQYVESSTRKEFYGLSTGEVSYESPNGNDIIVERTASLIMSPTGFEEFMYFTNDENPFGPNAGAYVSFGNSDVLEGRVHTNSPTITFSEYGCPDFLGRLSVTEPISYEGDSSCMDDMVDEDGESIIDTVSSIIYPPDNSANILRANAKRTFTADDMITFTPLLQDTLIMTELEFEETGGYYATQWWYLMPPVLAAPPEIDFMYDAVTPGQQVEDFSVQLMDADTWEEAWDDVTEYDGADFLIVDDTDIDGNNIGTFMTQVNAGDEMILESHVNNKKAVFVAASDPFNFFNRWIIALEPGSMSYITSTGEGFFHEEELFLTYVGEEGALNTEVPFNAFEFFHNHPDDGQSMCSADGFHHFDYRYWLCDDRYDSQDCVEEATDKSYVYSSRTFYPYTGPEVIYIQGGPVMVRGIVKGQYTVVTDDSVEYRRHDDATIIDQIWGNIWITGDIVYEDSYSNGAVIDPEDGGTNNVLGLVAGGNIILANTRENGARNNYQGENVNVNAALMALHGAFISHYWQNSVQSTFCPTCAIPNNSQPWFSLGDGRGGHRNPVLPESSNGNYTNNIDFRGTINLWGSIVQQERGYMKRNAPCSNPIPGGDCYTSEDIGYDKNYNYDYNLIDRPPPYYPDQSTVDGAIVLRLKSYGLVVGE